MENERKKIKRKKDKFEDIEDIPPTLVFFTKSKQKLELKYLNVN